MQISISTTLPASAEKVWGLLQKTDTLFEITRGWVHFSDKKSFPKRWETEDVVKTQIRPFGLGRESQYEIRVVHVDPNRKTIITDEHGAGVDAWKHTMKVIPIDDDECRYVDTIDFHAGMLTLLLGIYVKAYYGARHRRWKKLLHKR